MMTAEMTTQPVVEQTAVARVGDLTVAELRALMRDVVREIVQEALDERLEGYDPDEGLELRPEFVQELQEIINSDQRGRPAEEVFRELGLGD